MKNRAACAHFIKIFEVFMQKIGLRMAGVMWVWFCSQGVAMAERVLAGNRVEMQDLTLNLLT